MAAQSYLFIVIYTSHFYGGYLFRGCSEQGKVKRDLNVMRMAVDIGDLVLLDLQPCVTIVPFV